MSRYCVIGSGISGATIANLLSKNHSVDLFDNARGPGVRSSFKRLDKNRENDPHVIITCRLMRDSTCNKRQRTHRGQTGYIGLE